MQLGVYLLGPVRVERGETEIELPGEPGQRLLAYLALRNRTELSKDAVAEALWEERGAEANFRQALRSLRQALADGGCDPDEVLPTSRGSRAMEGTICLRADWVDAVEFERLAASERLEDLRGALLLYRGDLVAHLKDPREALLEARARLATIAEALRDRLAERSWERGDHAGALLYAAEAVRHDPESAEAQARLLDYIARAPDPHAAVRAGERAIGAGLEREAEARLERAIERRRAEPDGLEAEAGSDRPEPLAPAPPPPERLGRSRGRSQWLARLLVGGALAAAAALLLGFVLLGGDGGTDPRGAAAQRAASCRALSTPAAADLDATEVPAPELATAMPHRPIEVGPRPAAIAIGADGIWVGDRLGVVLVAADTREPVGDPIETPAPVRALALTASRVWALLADGELVGIDRAARRIEGEPLTLSDRGHGPGAELAAGSGALWAISPATYREPGTLIRIDPCAGTDRRIELPGRASALATGLGSVWVADAPEGTVARVDPASGDISALIDGLRGPRDLVVGGEGAWVLESAGGGRLSQVDDASDQIVGDPIAVEGSHATLALGAGAVWVAHRDGRLTRVGITSRAATPVETRLGEHPGPAAVGLGALWVVDRSHDAIRPFS